MKGIAISFLAAISTVLGHYNFPVVEYQGVKSRPWQYTRLTDNGYPVLPVGPGPVPNPNGSQFVSPGLTCFNDKVQSVSDTLEVEAGSKLTVYPNPTFVHEGVNNIYLAKAPNGNVTNFDGKGQVWFKIHEDTAIADGGTSISFPIHYTSSTTFTIPKNTPSGQYLFRVESLALHLASASGTQFYIVCGQIDIKNGGDGTPGPLAAFPGYYTGKEPVFTVDIWSNPPPATLDNPGPAIWTG